MLAATQKNASAGQSGTQGRKIGLFSNGSIFRTISGKLIQLRLFKTALMEVKERPFELGGLRKYFFCRIIVGSKKKTTEAFLLLLQNLSG